MYSVTGLSPVSFPHRLLTLGDYRDRVARCEVWKTFTAREAVQLQALLEFDRRKNGVHGRALKADIVGMLKGDRLEPHARFPDVSRDVPVGTPVLFWRSSAEHGIKHRNPLFDDETGIDPTRTISIDPLHCLSLGVFQSFIAALVAELIWKSNVWRLPGNADENRLAGTRRLSGELFAWYAAEAKAGRHHTRVQCLDPGMFGTEKKPKCKLHGAETNGVLEFSVELIRRHGPVMRQSDRWGACAKGLVLIKNMIKEYTGAWPPSKVQDVGKRSRFNWFTVS
jgi:hypothetical protein